MKERRTFLLSPGSGLNPKDVKVTGDGDEFQFRRGYEAATERRITAGLRELPGEVINSHGQKIVKTLYNLD